MCKGTEFIEQLVFSRTNSILGPLTVSISVTGIIETSPSFLSMGNASGPSTPYNLTESYSVRLISERERSRRGAREHISFLGEGSILCCHFDNWDILPLREMEADSKTIPKINGSLLQGADRNRRPEELQNEASSVTFDLRSMWNLPSPMPIECSLRLHFET